MKYSLTFFASILLFSCSPHQKWDGKIIKEEGGYILNESGLFLSINCSDDLIEYKLSHLESQEIILSNKNLSIYHKWLMYWDKAERLWVYNSDVGAFVWIKEEDKSYQYHCVMDEKSLLDKMPIEFKNNISQSYFMIIEGF